VPSRLSLGELPIWRGGLSAIALCLVGCSSEPLSPAHDEDPSGLGGKLLTVRVPSSGEVLVALGAPSVVAATSEARTSLAWDLGFRGFEVFTNGGASSSGAGAAFGLLSPPVFLSDTAPAVPFLTTDQPGGAFRRWFAYDAENHVILSRFHVYGIRDGTRRFKVQLLAYYGGRNSEISANYTLRYAEVDEQGSGPTQELTNLDASVNNDATNPDAPSLCVDLASGEQFLLTPAEARASSVWQLCFRRDAISVNGGVGGPRGVTALDFDAAASASEDVAELRSRTAQSELARFDAIGALELSDPDASFSGDGLVTAFSGRWLLRSEPPAPAPGVWLVVGADGASQYLVLFERFEGASGAGPGSVHLRVKAVL
jgi:hypothetical protein